LAKIVVISGPAGVGKGTLIKEILQSDQSYRLSISHTTRPRRQNELSGREYYFVSLPEFKQMQQEKTFLETAMVHGNYYGTSRKEIERLMAQQQNVLLEIDVQGAQAIRQYFPEALLFFIEPPSWEELEKRLRGRGTENPETLHTRLETARKELQNNDFFNYHVINDNLQETVKKILDLIRGGKNA